jgi:uncharacterized repeat protein (TIGR03803 family)
MREPRHVPASSLKFFVQALAVGSVLLVPVAYAQTYTVLHNFTGGADGALPFAGLTMDAAGNLYGTTAGFGRNGCGTVYKLTRHSNAWTFGTLYSFRGLPDACSPQSRVVFGPSGLLYGAAAGGSNEDGAVYKLQPPDHICASISCEWTETVLYSFTDVPDGAYPRGDVVFDSAGNLYGATRNGGSSGYACADDEPCGAVYELTPSPGGWSESIIYSFEGLNDGAFPNGVFLDSTGHLVGTTSFRGNEGQSPWGTVFSLAPNGQGQWTETTLHSFSGGQDGGSPLAGVIADASGGFYGTTSWQGSGAGGTVWQFTSSGLLNILASLTGSGYEPGPEAALTMDAAGNLYGTTAAEGAFNQGSVFKLTPSNGGWTLTTLHSFTGGADGGTPTGQLILDANGNIYGTTVLGGSGGQCSPNAGCGVVFEITPQ